MADFNVNLAAPQAAGAGVIKPTTASVTEFANPWIAPIASLAGTFLKNQEENKKKEAEDAKNLVLGEFTKKQAALSDAFAQGAKAPVVGARSRALMAEYSANYPALAEEFAKKMKPLTEYSELGAAKDEETIFRELKKEKLQTLQKSGVLVDDKSPQNVIDAEWAVHQANARADESLKRASSRFELFSKMSAEDRTREEANQKSEALSLISEIRDKKLTAAFDWADNLVNQHSVLTDPNKFDISSQNVARYFSSIDAAIAAVSAQNPTLAAPTKKLFDDLKELTLKRIDPKVKAEEVSNQWKLMKDKLALDLANKEPAVRATIAMTHALGGPQSLQYLKLAQEENLGSAYIRSIADQKGNPYVGFTPKQVESALMQTQYQIGRAARGENPNGDKALVELARGTNNVLQYIASIPVNKISIEDQHKAFNFLASDEYKVMRDKGLIDKEQAEAANRVFGMMYQRGVSKSIEERMGQVFREPGNPRAAAVMNKDLVDIKWGGTGVVFEPTKIREKGIMLSMMDEGARKLLLHDMETSNKALNKLVNAGANLAGVSPDKYWEENKHNILPSYFPDPARLKPGQVVTFPDGSKKKYIGGNYRDVQNSYEVVKSE